MRKFLTLDDSQFPTVIVKYHNFIPSKEEFLQMQTDLEQCIARHTNFVLLVDLTDMPFLPAEYRIAQGKWSTKNDPVFVQQKIRIAFCTPSIIAQMMLKGVLILSKPGVPYTVASSVEKGFEWGKQQLEKK